MLEALGIDGKKLPDAQQDIVREDVILPGAQCKAVQSSKLNQTVLKRNQRLC